MVNTILFDIHKNYIVTYNSRVYAVISIFQRSPWARGASVGCSTGLRYSSASGRVMHPLVRFMRQSPFNLLFDYLQCTIDVLFGYFILLPEGGLFQLIVNIFCGNESIYKKAIIRLLE